MKQLLFMRHAKSDWSNPSLPDFERPLKRRGHKDAAAVAEKIHQMAFFPDLMLVSPARRALETAAKVSAVLRVSDDKFQTEPKLYPGSLEDFAAVISELPEEINRVCLIGHNPIISDYVSILIRQDIQMKTATAVFCEIPGKWSELSVSEQFTVINA